MLSAQSRGDIPRLGYCQMPVFQRDVTVLKLKNASEQAAQYL
jgi:hypothetical protein